MIHILFLGGRNIAGTLKYARDAFGIMHVHLAAECMHVEHAPTPHGGRVDGRFGQFRGTLRLGHHVFIHNAPCYRQGRPEIDERGDNHGDCVNTKRFLGLFTVSLGASWVHCCP